MNQLLESILENPQAITVVLAILGGLAAYLIGLRIVRPAILHSLYKLYKKEGTYSKYTQTPLTKFRVRWGLGILPSFYATKYYGDEKASLDEVKTEKLYWDEDEKKWNDVDEWATTYEKDDVKYLLTQKVGEKATINWTNEMKMLAGLEILTGIALFAFIFWPDAGKTVFNGQPARIVQATLVSTAVVNAPIATATLVPTSTPTPTQMPTANEPLVIELDRAYPEATWWQFAGPDISMPDGWQIPEWLRSQETVVIYPMPKGMGGYVVISGYSGILLVNYADDHLNVVNDPVVLSADKITIHANGLSWGVIHDDQSWYVSPEPQGNVTINVIENGKIPLVVEPRGWAYNYANWHIFAVLFSLLGIVSLVGLYVVRRK